MSALTLLIILIGMALIFDFLNGFHDSANADLFTKPKDFKELMAMLRRREVYRHVSNMSDRADAANLFGMVVMKLT